MVIEKDDLFVITRGFELNNVGMPAFFGVSSAQTSTSKRYDRSHEGRVYRALEIAGPCVVAELVADTGWGSQRKVGERSSLNLSELEVMTVADGYLAALQRPEKAGG